MTSNVIMPQGGQDITVGRVVRWLKREGDPVRKGETVCEVETEKAVFEVTSPTDGVLLKILAADGCEAEVFSVIGLIGSADEATAPPGERPLPTVAITDSVPAAVGPQLPIKSGGAPISPRARRLAEELGVPVEDLTGTGPRGRVMEHDVELAAERLHLRGSERSSEKDTRRAEITDTVGPWTPAGPPEAPARGRVMPMSKTGKILARRMQHSKQTAPHFYVQQSIDMTEALRLRSDFNARVTDPDLKGPSINDLFVRACALALRDFPQLNASVRDEDNLILWDEVNIGIATALADALVVPVLARADTIPLRQLGAATKKLLELAHRGVQASLDQGHFTLSNLGMFDVEGFTAIINPPEAAVLAVGKIERRIVVRPDDSLALRDMVNTTLSVDHRVVDGAHAARFLNRIKTLLEDPESLL